MVRRGPLEARVLEALGRRLMDPELTAVFVAEFTGEWNRLTAEASAAGAIREQALQQVERQVTNLVDAIAEGLRAPGLQARLDALEARRARLQAEALAAPASAPLLHPKLAEIYRTRVADLHRVLASGDAPDALEAARALIDRIIVHPPGDGGGSPSVELIGDLLACWARRALADCGKRPPPACSACLQVR
jgi:site-specific DNA recombinase